MPATAAAVSALNLRRLCEQDPASCTGWTVVILGVGTIVLAVALVWLAWSVWKG